MTNYARDQIEYVLDLAHELKRTYERYVDEEAAARHLIKAIQPKAEEKTDMDVRQFWDLVSSSMASAFVMMCREYEALKTFVDAAEEANMPFSDEDVIEKGA